MARTSCIFMQSLVEIHRCMASWERKVGSFFCSLAKVNLCSHSLYAVSCPSVCLSVICNVRAPYSGDWNFRQSFYSHLIRYPSVDIQVKFYGDRHMGTPPSGEFNTRGVAEYSDCGPIERYISEKVQDRS